jgi:hypothetical protein
MNVKIKYAVHFIKGCNMKQLNRIYFTLFFIFSGIFMLNGCGGSKEETQPPTPVVTNPTTPTPAVNKYVRYEGTTLIVFGKYYYQIDNTQNGKFASSQIIVKAKLGMESELKKSLEFVSLEIIRQLAVGALLVTVPAGFEQQWVRALSEQSYVEYAELDGISGIN